MKEVDLNRVPPLPVSPAEERRLLATHGEHAGIGDKDETRLVYQYHHAWMEAGRHVFEVPMDVVEELARNAWILDVPDHLADGEHVMPYVVRLKVGLVLHDQPNYPDAVLLGWYACGHIAGFGSVPVFQWNDKPRVKYGVGYHCSFPAFTCSDEDGEGPLRPEAKMFSRLMVGLHICLSHGLVMRDPVVTRNKARRRREQKDGRAEQVETVTILPALGAYLARMRQRAEDVERPAGGTHADPVPHVVHEHHATKWVREPMAWEEPEETRTNEAGHKVHAVQRPVREHVRGHGEGERAVEVRRK